MTDKPSLTAAYDLKTPYGALRLYADWAATYDKTFADAHGYIMHEHVARAYVNAGGFQPVLDIGAGTGLCGAALRARGLDDVHATDISGEMLAVAEAKNIYTTLFTGDILARLNVADNSYAGVVSSGTFTHGHVGPEALDEVLRIVRPKGWIAVSINKEHFESAGFATKFKALAPQINALTLTAQPIYNATARDADAPDHAQVHGQDLGLVALFTKR